MFQFLERKNRLCTRERNDRISVLLLFKLERNRSVPQFFFSLCRFSEQQLHQRMYLGKKSYRSVFWPSFAPHCLFTRKWNGMIAYRSTFRITFFIVSLFGTERCYFKRSRVNTPMSFPLFGTERHGTERLRSRVNWA